MNRDLFFKLLLYASLTSTLLIKQSDHSNVYDKPNNNINLDHLIVNKDIKKRVIVNKDLEGGLNDLGQLCLISPYEEYYIFFPKLNLWVEIGYDEEIINFGKTFQSKVKQIKRNDLFKIPYFRQTDEFIFVHFHPSNNIWLEYAKSLPIKQRVYSKELKKHDIEKYNDSVLNLKFKYFNEIKEAFIPLSDLINLYYNQTYISKKISNSKTNFIVVSEHGVSSYGLKDINITFKDFLHSITDLNFSKTENGFILENDIYFIKFKNQKVEPYKKPSFSPNLF